MKAVIVLPTYNEKENIEKMLSALVTQFSKIEKQTNFSMHVLVMDDSSPDGTAEVVERFAKRYSSISLATGKKQGLGRAYIRGFQYAIEKLKADVVMEMDADFSHDPKDIIRLLKQINKGYDFVIGSRYVKGGTIPKEWSLLRKMNSKFGNIFARYIAGIPQVKDCTAGFRAIRTSLLNTIDLDTLKVQGYSFQMNLLFSAVNSNARVKEVPVHFTDRVHGVSKIGLSDIIEFMTNACFIRLQKTNKIVLEKVPFLYS